MKWNFLVAVLALALTGMGVHRLYTSRKNRQPQVYDVEEFINAPSPAQWVRLTGGVADMTGVSYKSFLGVGPISKIYIPVRPLSDSPEIDPALWRRPERPVHVLLATKNPTLLYTAAKLRRLKGEEEVLRFIFEHRDEVLVKGSVEGVIKSEFEIGSRELFKLRQLNPGLASDFIVLSDGEKPPALEGIGYVICGVALGTWLFLRIRVGDPTDVSPPPLPPAPPPLPRP